MKGQIIRQQTILMLRIPNICISLQKWVQMCKKQIKIAYGLRIGQGLIREGRKKYKSLKHMGKLIHSAFAFLCLLFQSEV
jgi:hypothetical protein